MNHPNKIWKQHTHDGSIFCRFIKLGFLERSSIDVGKYTIFHRSYGFPSLPLLNLRDLFQTTCSRDFTMKEFPWPSIHFGSNPQKNQAPGPCPFWCGLCHFKGVRWGRWNFDVWTRIFPLLQLMEEIWNPGKIMRYLLYHINWIAGFLNHQQYVFLFKISASWWMDKLI